MLLDYDLLNQLNKCKFGEEYQDLDGMAVTQLAGVALVLHQNSAMGEHKKLEMVEAVAIKEGESPTEFSALLTKNNRGWYVGERAEVFGFLDPDEKYWYYLPSEISHLLFASTCFMRVV